MHSGHNSDEEEELAVQNVARAIGHVEQCVNSAQARLGQLAGIVVPHSELTTDFALGRTELDAERNRIKSCDLATSRHLAESYLLRFKESDRRYSQQSNRLGGLETRLTLAETICDEQMRLNREIADESIRALRQFAEAERKRISTVKTANARKETAERELGRAKAQCEQQEQTIGRMRDQTNAFSQEISGMAQQLDKLELEKKTLLRERDHLVQEADSLRNLMVQRDDLVEELRERERRTAVELRERDALIEKLAEERDRRSQELLRAQREFESLLVEKEHDAERFLDARRKEIVAEQRAKHRADTERYEATIKRMRKDFENALQEALRETQKLAAQREEYFNNWRRLEETMETHKRKLQAAVSRKMVSKCTELVRDLKEIGGGTETNGFTQTTTPRTLEPVENVAQRFLDEMASQRESGMS